MTLWLSDILIGSVIQVSVNDFSSNQINPEAGIPQGAAMSPLLFLHYSFLRQQSPSSAPQTKLSIPIRWWYYTMGFQLKRTFCSKIFRTGPSKLGNVVCQRENQTKSRKTKVIIFYRSILARPNLKSYGETLKVYPQVKFLGITFDSQLNFKKHFEDRCNTRYYRLRLLANKN